MIRKGIFSLFIFFSVFGSLFAQLYGSHPYVIRGEVVVDLEPIYAGHVDSEYPLDIPAAGRRALEEAAMFFSGMIYGWSFFYEPGERARRTEEYIEIVPVGIIQFGDSGLRVTETQINDMRLKVWADYHLNDAQQRRFQAWNTGMTRNIQAIGYSPSYLQEYPGWLSLKKTALEDAAKVALRSALRGSERNRPKEVTGFISLASFPRYFIDGSCWAVSARFKVQITEIVPFAAY